MHQALPSNFMASCGSWSKFEDKNLISLFLLWVELHIVIKVRVANV